MKKLLLSSLFVSAIHAAPTNVVTAFAITGKALVGASYIYQNSITIDTNGTPSMTFAQWVTNRMFTVFISAAEAVPVVSPVRSLLDQINDGTIPLADIQALIAGQKSIKP